MVKIPRIPQINGKVGLRAAEDRRRQAAGPRPQKKTKKGHKNWAGQKQRCLKHKTTKRQMDGPTNRGLHNDKNYQEMGKPKDTGLKNATTKNTEKSC